MQQKLLAKLSDYSFELVAILSVVMTIVYGSDKWPMTTFGTVLLTVAVLQRKVVTTYTFWLLMSGVSAFTFGLFWYTEGDGFLLQIYWSIAILLAVNTSERDTTLSEMARLLIGVVFLLAVGSKLASPDFMSGAFYEVFLVYDFGRVGMIGLFLTDLSLVDANANANAAQLLPEQSVTLISAPGIRQLAVVLTGLTLVVEAALAAAFLLKLPLWVRDGVLILFLAGTYLVAPIVVFGVTLAIMGFAQTSPSKVKAIYLFFVLFIQLTPLRTYIPLIFMS